MQKRIADLQTREAQITQRVSELRAMFANAFSGFGASNLSVVNAVDGEGADDNSEEPAATFDEDVADEAQQGDEVTQSAESVESAESEVSAETEVSAESVESAETVESAESVESAEHADGETDEEHDER